MRALIEHSPSEGFALMETGEWIAGPLWESWRATLEPRGLAWPQFVQIVTGYGNELRLWVVGERTWEHCVEGLAGRVVRRLPMLSSTDTARPHRPPARHERQSPHGGGPDT
jgi:hypothetical protein